MLLELTSVSVISTVLVHWGVKTASASSVTTDKESRVMIPPDGRVNGVQCTLVEDEVVVGASTISQIARSFIVTKRRAVD